MSVDFVIVGRTRNIPKILEVCKALDSVGKTYYCFATNKESHQNAGFDLYSEPDKLASNYENCDLTSDAIRIIFDKIFANIEELKDYFKAKQGQATI